MKRIEVMIENSGLKPTPNRILVLNEIVNSLQPLSLGELDVKIGTLEKSSILRALSVLLEHHLIHDIEDGRGVVKYEICSGHDTEIDTDMHVHFYCTECQKTICLEEIPVPVIPIPDGFQMTSVNYMMKGICPSCKNRL